MTASRYMPSISAALLPLLLAAAPAAARLAVHPTSYNLQVGQGDILQVPLHITNLGPVSPLGYQVTDDRDWLSESPTSGQIAMGDTVEVTVTVDARSLTPGDYSGTITVTDPHHGPIPIPVALRVEETSGTKDDRGRGPGRMIWLAQSIPNPMSHQAGIRFALPSGSVARLAVLDVQGREITVLFLGPVPGGETTVQWDGSDRLGRPVPSGRYFYALESGGRSLVRPLVKIH